MNKIKHNTMTLRTALEKALEIRGRYILSAEQLATAYMIANTIAKRG